MLRRLKRFRDAAGSSSASDDTGSAVEPWTIPYDPAATTDDILACFRLLLGRPPNREEWRGHSLRAGEPLSSVVASYLNSLEFSRRGLLQADHLGEAEMVELDEFRILAAVGDTAVGRYVREGNYEPEVTAVFRRMLRPGMGVLDLGANIGYFTLLSAALVGEAGHVVAVEPNPANVKLLEASRRANGFRHVTVCQVAAGREPGLLVLNTSHSNGTTSGLPDDINAVLGAVVVPCVRAETLVPPGRRTHLIKVDVEGAEYTALLGCRELIARDRPLIVTEFSPGAMPGISGIEGREYLAWLRGLGYGIGVVLPDSSVREAASDDAVLEEHEAKGIDHLDLVAWPN